MQAKKTFFKSKSSKEPGKALSLYKHNVGWDGDKKDEKKDQGTKNIIMLGYLNISLALGKEKGLLK